MNIKDLNTYLFEIKRRDNPNFPEHALVPVKHSDKTANGLEKAIVAFLQAEGWQAERIKNTGRYVDESYTYVNVMGQTRKAGTGKYIKGTGTNGSADLSCIIRSKKQTVIPWKIEVKMKDKQSAAQKKYEQDVFKAGGHYSIVHNFTEFHAQYIWLLENK